MKKTLLSLSFLFSALTASSQVTVFEDSFDTYNDFLITGFGSWLTIDIDQLNTYVVTGGSWTNSGAKQAYIIFNPTTATGVTNSSAGCATDENRNFDTRTGDKYAACWDGVPAGGVNANNDWLVSPPINLTGATGPQLSFWVKSLSDCYGLEKYRVGVYTGTGTPTTAADFTIISGATDLSAPYGTWSERTQSLVSYVGQTIRIGIQCKSADAYMFMVDDFKVTATTLSNDTFLANAFSVSPNPANDFISVKTSEDLSIESLSIVDLNGRTVKNVENNFESINVTDLNTGIYMLNIKSEKGLVTKKISIN